MSFPSKFEEIWSGRDTITFVEPEPESIYCRWAETLHAYAAELIELLAAQAAPPEEQIFVTMLRIQRHYFRFLEHAPKAHREHRSRRGHVCLHPVYEDAYRQLDALREKAEELRLFRQPKPRKHPAASPPAASLADILRGSSS